MHTSTDVLSALRNPSIPMSTDEIRQAWALLKSRHANVQVAAVRTYRYGDQVQFRTRTGATENATVIRTNLKTVTVKTPSGTEWRVSPSILTNRSL